MADVIQSYGLFWREADVFWGAGRQKGELLGVPARRRRSMPIGFREQIGIWLYDGHQMVYVGQTGSGKKQRLFSLLVKTPQRCDSGSVGHALMVWDAASQAQS